MVSAFDGSDAPSGKGKDKQKPLGGVLAVEWLGPDFNLFIVGFQAGFIQIFKAESAQ